MRPAAAALAVCALAGCSGKIPVSAACERVAIGGEGTGLPAT